MSQSLGIGEYYTTIAQVIKDHAADIGRVAIAWNAIHSTFCNSFVYLVTPSARKVGEAVWNALKSDRSQRDIFSAAIKAALPPSDLQDEFAWLLSHFDRLEERRNNIVHSPYGLIIDAGRGHGMFPDSSTGNLRAAKLAGKDFKLECLNLAKTLDDLSRFTRKLTDHLHTDRSASSAPQLPSRPLIQSPAHPGQKQTPQAQNQAKHRRRERQSGGKS